MIKPVQRQSQQPPSSPVSSAKGTGKTEAMDSTASMHVTAEKLKGLGPSLPLGAGKHSFTASPADEKLSTMTDEIVGKRL
ncbi:MAG: hypothetical protein JSR93_03455 [Verrucomicrobia bacterium]|nr:hypothetical protein [Verrucomicrobiota bacterium]